GMVAVATPFRGSRYARYLLGRTLRAFSPRDAALLALAAERGVDARITAVYPRFDPHIPETGRLEGGRNVELPLAGHFLPLGGPTLVDVVVREVDRIARPAPHGGRPAQPAAGAASTATRTSSCVHRVIAPYSPF